MNAGAEEHHLRIALPRLVALQWVGEEMERMHPVSVDLEGQQRRGRHPEGDAVPQDHWNQPQARRKQLGGLYRLGASDGDFEAALSIKRGKGRLFEVGAGGGNIIHRLKAQDGVSRSDFGHIHRHVQFPHGHFEARGQRLAGRSRMGANFHRANPLTGERQKRDGGQADR